MKKVDLALAVNYVPACVCLCKALVLMLVLSAIQPGEEIRGGFIPIAAMLYLDRAVIRNMIFDANAILLALYFANVHAAVRATSHRQAYPVLLGGLHLCWAGMCLTLLAEPWKVRWFLDSKRLQASKLVPVFMMLLVLVGTSYVHAPLESGPVRACRALAFTLLAFAWIYVVGIHTQLGLEYLKENSAQFVARLAPILYSPLWIAFLFCPGVVWGLVAQHIRLTQLQAYQPLPMPNSSMPASPDDSQLATIIPVQKPHGSTSESHSSVESSSDLEALFRQAKQALTIGKGRPSPLDTIQEVL
jgi:hypothetical protein